MRTIALRIVILWGWRRALVAALAGAAAAFAMAPYGFIPVLFISFPVLVWLLDGAFGEPGRPIAAMWSATIIGWCFGFGYFLVGLHWVGEAFLVDAQRFAWMLPFVLSLFPAFLALFTGAACALAMLIWSPGFGRICGLASAWAIMEWIRGHVLTGFPWNAIGYALAPSDLMIQSASLWGIYGLCFLVVLIAAAPATLADDYVQERPILAKRGLGPAVMFMTVAGLAIFGYVRLSDVVVTAVDKVHIRIVQPNISQADKWKAGNQNRIFAKYLELSNRATSPETMGIDDVSHLIWPESAVPFLLARKPDALAAVAALLPDNTVLVTGALRKDDQPRSRVFNSIMVVGSQGEIASVYDKAHLVPFGEYLPLEDWLKPLGLRKLVAMPLGFGAGSGRRSVTAGNAPPFSPLVCYEIIFAGEVTDGKNRPGWMLNVTNDAWFGTSTGPHQHFAQARMRAVEEGLPLIRAANTGISAVVDPYGRIIKQLGLNTSGVLDTRLPVALPATPFVRHGSIIAFVLLFSGFVIGFAFKILS